MRILVLEDNEERRRHFKKGLIGHTCAIVETAQDAIEALKAETWEIAFLDHDLYQQAYVMSGPGTGYEVAEWLSRNKDRMPKRVYVHSFNEKGRKRMLEALPEAIAVPGVWVNLAEFLKGGAHDDGSEVGDVPGMRLLRVRLWVPGAE